MLKWFKGLGHHKASLYTKNYKQLKNAERGEINPLPRMPIGY